MKSLLIEAGPGSGKTTTMSYITTYLRATNREIWKKNHRRITEEQQAILDWCDENLPPEARIIGMAYNKEAADDLGKRVHKSVECRSVHGWGYKVLQQHYRGYIPINEGVVNTIIEKVTGKPLGTLKDKYQWVCAGKFFEKLKDELMEPTLDNLQLVSQKYADLASYKFDNDTVQRISQLLPEAKRPDKKRGIQYIDQVWLACFILAKQEPLYDVAIIDECQDISAARRFLASRIAKHKIWVGDRYQAINAFAGADAKSIDKIISLNPSPEILPLKTSFRNPPNIITTLNNLRPLARLKTVKTENGIEKRISLQDYAPIVKEAPSTTLTICRTNAPLIRAAYALLEAEVPCRILGDRVVDQLVYIVNRHVKPGQTMEMFLQALKRYENGIVSGLDEYIAELFQDKINCIRLVASKVENPDEIVKALKTVFKPSDSSSYATLCTIHKAKGKEANNVFILFPPIQSPLAKTEEQKEQEINLEYVARSRTCRDLYWVIE